MSNDKIQRVIDVTKRNPKCTCICMIILPLSPRYTAFKLLWEAWQRQCHINLGICIYSTDTIYVTKNTMSMEVLAYISSYKCISHQYLLMPRGPFNGHDMILIPECSNHQNQFRSPCIALISNTSGCALATSLQMDKVQCRVFDQGTTLCAPGICDAMSLVRNPFMLAR